MNLRRWLAYVWVDLFESEDLVVRAHENGLEIRGSAIGSGMQIIVRFDNFDLFARSLEKHDPAVPYPFKSGGVWTTVAPRYLRRLRRETALIMASYRSLPGAKS